MKYTSINIQGNLISEEILQKIETAEAPGQLVKDFGFESSINLRSEIEYAWSRIKLDWKHFSERSEKLPASDPYGTTLSRKWMTNFFSALGFDMNLQKTALKGDNEQQYAISHTCVQLDDLPIHITGFLDPTHPEKNTLDMRSSGGTSRLSPHATIQEYLNVTEHLYAMITNGLLLRLVRDSGRLVKLTYIEFDLRRLLEEDKYSEFTLLYRLLHVSRFPRTKQETEESLLEKYYQDSIESGNRIRDGLSNAVRESMVALGKGFLQHPSNIDLCEKIASGSLTPKDYYRQLLRIIYRLLFLMVTEERDLIYNPDDKSEVNLRLKRIYLDYYSIARLRKLSEIHYTYEAKYTDLWQGLLNTFLLFDEGGSGQKLGISPLAGELFSYNATKDLQECNINNKLLLECIRNLNVFYDENNNLVAVNYRMLDVEELGSVYEALLDLHPVIENIQSDNSSHIIFIFHEGTERKTTGSYYTRPELVNELIKSALIPVIEERLKANAGNKEAQDKALLGLKVCDAASGSGHMLLAAARTIAWYLAQIRSGEDNPAPSLFRSCLREVIQHCIYAVDYNPDAVELCKLALWIEGHNSGKPLSFLDHKIRNGNSLVGVTDLNVLQKGIPTEAYTPVTGDDKKVSQWYKKLAREENKSVYQARLEFEATSAKDDEAQFFASEYKVLEELPEENVEDIHKKEEKFNSLRSNAKWFKDWNACNLWTAAYFYTYSELDDPAVPTSSKLKTYLKNPSGVDGRMVGKVMALSIQYKFFHWPLEFPDVFEQGGFDVFLGNPPWEKIKLEEKQFFSTRVPEIKNARTKSARRILINKLPRSNPQIWQEYIEAIHRAESESKFVRFSDRFTLSAKGDINTYLLFTELVYRSTNKSQGRSGIIIPIGLVAESTSKEFFDYLVNSNSIESFYGFVNTKKIFRSIKDYIKFGLLTLGNSKSARFCFWLTEIIQLMDKNRIFSITKDEIELINPNTKTCPIFRTLTDAAITKKVYANISILDKDESENQDWKPIFNRIFDMSNDSELFTENPSSESLPLYEAKMIWNYDHRFSTYENATQANINEGNLPQLTPEMHIDPNKRILARYCIPKESIQSRIGTWQKKWFLVFRGIAATNNERTFIYSIIPFIGVGNSAPAIMFQESINTLLTAAFLANANSLIYGYIGRQKAAGSNLNFYIIRQMPVLQPSDYNPLLLAKILPKVFELTYSSWDIKSFADDLWNDAGDELKVNLKQQWEENQAVTGGHEWSPPEWCKIDKEGCPLPPFKWDDGRRAELKAELDAIYAKLYGLTTEELRYILDPQDVYGPDFPGETFRVLKEKEIRLYGEYRTRRLVLEAWERLEKEGD